MCNFALEINKTTAMPRILHRNLRFRTIDRCLRDMGREYRMCDLVEQCNLEMLRVYGVGISRRTVQYDISIMRAAPFEVELDETLLRRGVYRYADTGCGSLFWTKEDDEDRGVAVEAKDVCVLRFGSEVVGDLVRMMLSLGEGVEVVAPAWLRERISKQVVAMNKKYQQE